MQTHAYFYAKPAYDSNIFCYLCTRIVKHIHIYNPFIEDTACGLYFEESKTLKDFIGYGPNYLHYYEHIVGSFLDLGTYEGMWKYEAFTSITGICLCSIIEKEEICKRKLKDYIEGRNNMSEGKFDLKSINLETL